MSTRSPMNKRSQTKEVTGMARKSAASAKPARAAASSVHVVSSSSKSRRKELEKGESLAGLSREEKRARKQELRAKDDRIYTVSTLLTQDDEDYKKRRRLWWMLLGLGMLTILILWVWLFMGGTNGSDASADYCHCLCLCRDHRGVHLRFRSHSPAAQHVSR